MKINKIKNRFNDYSYRLIPTYGDAMAEHNKASRSLFKNKASQYNNVKNIFYNLISKLPPEKYNCYSINGAITKTIYNIYYLNKDNNLQELQGWNSYQYYIEYFYNLLFKYEGKLYSKFDLDIVESKALKNTLTKLGLIDESNRSEIEAAIDTLYSALISYKYYSKTQYATAYKYFYDKRHEIIDIIPHPLYVFSKNENIKSTYLNFGSYFYTCYEEIPIVYLPNKYARLIDTDSFIELFPKSFTQRDLPVLNNLLTELSKIVRAATKYEISKNPCIYLENNKTHFRFTYDLKTYQFRPQKTMQSEVILKKFSVTSFYPDSEFFKGISKKLFKLTNGNLNLINKLSKLLAIIIANNISVPKINVILLAPEYKYSSLNDFENNFKALPKVDLKYLLTSGRFSDISKAKFYGYSYIITSLISQLDKNNIYILNKMISGNVFKSGQKTLFNTLPIIAISAKSNYTNDKKFMGISKELINFIDLSEVTDFNDFLTINELFYLANYGIILHKNPRGMLNADNIVSGFLSSCFYDDEKSKEIYSKYKRNESQLRPSTKSSDVKKLFDIYCQKYFSEEQINYFTLNKKNFIINQLKQKYKYIRPHYSDTENNCWGFSKLIIDPEKVKLILSLEDFKENKILSEQEIIDLLSIYLK